MLIKFTQTLMKHSNTRSHSKCNALHMVFITPARRNKMFHSNDPSASWDQECMKNNYEYISSKWLPFFLISKGERAEKNMRRKKKC